MKITEQHLDRILNEIESKESALEEFWEQTCHSYPELTNYILNVDRNILTEMEYSQMIISAMVILKAYEQSGLALDYEDLQEEISIVEDKNWEIMSAQRGEFQKKLNVFFDGYHEEDLLAFVEDTLTDDDNGEITPVGREVSFIKLKTLIDILFI